jgi:hypothetical protein
MSQRVLSTEQARAAVQQMQAIINSGLQQEVTRLAQQGHILSDQNVWDGPLAAQFRGDIWPGAQRSMEQMIQQLETLRTSVQQINADIMAAGS